MINRLKNYFSIPLGILIVGILTFLFGPGQCTKLNESRINDQKTILEREPLDNSGEKDYFDLSDSLDYDIEQESQSTDYSSDTNLVELILGHKYALVDDYIINNGVDEAIINLRVNKSESLDSSQNKLVTRFIRNLLIRKEYGVDNAFIDTAPGLIIIEKENKYGFINSQGQIIFPPQFKDIEPISFHPYVAVLDNEKWNLMDSTGNMVLPKRYDKAEPIIDSYNYCILSDGDEIDVFDLKKGKFKFTGLNTFDRIWVDRIVINVEEKVTLFDLELNRLVEEAYDSIRLIEGVDDYYIKMIDGKDEIYFNLGMNEVPNPLTN